MNAMASRSIEAKPLANFTAVDYEELYCDRPRLTDRPTNRSTDRGRHQAAIHSQDVIQIAQAVAAKQGAEAAEQATSSDKKVWTTAKSPGTMKASPGAPSSAAATTEAIDEVQFLAASPAETQKGCYSMMSIQKKVPSLALLEVTEQGPTATVPASERTARTAAIAPPSAELRVKQLAAQPAVEAGVELPADDEADDEADGLVWLAGERYFRTLRCSGGNGAFQKHNFDGRWTLSEEVPLSNGFAHYEHRTPTGQLVHLFHVPSMHGCAPRWVMGPVPGADNGWGFVDTDAVRPEMIVDNKWMLWMQVCWEESESITFQGVTPVEETEQAEGDDPRNKRNKKRTKLKTWLKKPLSKANAPPASTPVPAPTPAPVPTPVPAPAAPPAESAKKAAKKAVKESAAAAATAAVPVPAPARGKARGSPESGAGAGSFDDELDLDEALAEGIAKKKTMSDRIKERAAATKASLTKAVKK